jgi:enolase
MEQQKIKSIKAREILDSKNNPTVEVLLETDAGKFSASVASGVSAGKYEAMELRDEDGRGVKKAIKNIEEIITPVLKEESLDDQNRIDEILINLDGTKNKSRLGANALLPISVAVCRALAQGKKISLYQQISQLSGKKLTLPKPSFNMIEGGKHAENNLAFQEFMIVPQKETFKENLQIGKMVYEKLGEILKEKFGQENVGLSKEGAFTAAIGNIGDALNFIWKAANKIGFEYEIKFAIDAAASEICEKGFYLVDGKKMSAGELTEFYKDLVRKYPMFSIEDAFSEEEFQDFSFLNKAVGDKIIIIGDDLTVSNIERIKMAQENKSCSGLILKPNQIGTVSETIEAAKLAQSYGWKIMVSNRGGETQDSFIADLAVGIGAEFIKSGAPFPKERMAKYNRLIKIEEEIYG